MANNIQTDVTFPPGNAPYTQTELNFLNTSLSSYSVRNTPNASPHTITVNMQAFDTGFTGPGQYYYAIRVNTDTPSLYYGNIRMSSINFG